MNSQGAGYSHDQLDEISKNFYQTSENVKHDMIRNLSQVRTILSQNVSSTLGTQVNYVLPNDSWLSNVIINFNFKTTAAPHSICANFLENLIRNIQVRLGSSDQFQLETQKVGVFLKLMKCPTAEKVTQLLNMAGGAVRNEAGNNARTYNFYAVLDLMEFSGPNRKSPLPAYLLSSGISLQFDLAPLASVMPVGAIDGSAQMNLLVCQVVPYNGMNIRSLQESEVYSHHFGRPYQYASAVIPANGSSVTNTVNVNSLPVGLLRGLGFYLIEQDSETWDAQANSKKLNYQRAVKLSNVKVLLNGANVYFYQGASTQSALTSTAPAVYNAYDAIEFCNSQSKTTYLVPILDDAITAVKSVEAFFYYVPMGGKRWDQSQDVMVANGPNLNSQTIQITFDVPDITKAYNFYYQTIHESKIDIHANGSVSLSAVI